MLCGCIYGINPAYDEADASTEANSDETSESTGDEGETGMLGLCDQDELGLVACYTFESLEGGSVLDGSGASNDGVAYGVSLAEGVEGLAGSFDGTAAISIPHDDSIAVLPDSEGFTLETWLYLDSLPAPPNNLYGVAQKGTNYHIRIGPDAALRCEVGKENSPSIPIEAGVWQHVACVWDGVALRVYKNGVQLDAKVTEVTLDLEQAPLVIASDETFSQGLRGRLDTLRIWSQPRSQAELCDAAGPACP